MSTLADRIRGVLQTPGAPTVAQPPSHGFGEPRALESIPGGAWRDGSFVIEKRRDSSSAHGRETVGMLARRLDAAAAEAPVVAGTPAQPPFLFFDLETTGLSGGAGTHAFLVGCGWFDEDDGFVTRQHLLTRYEDERRLLTSVAAELARAGSLVSFNGKSFDAPVLETRYLYHRLEWTARRLPHLDMLHLARRFWKRDAPDVASGFSRTNGHESSCSLIALEQQQLGHRRHGDVPGFEIPSRYFHFVRSGDPAPLEAVFEHNRLDLLSLAALTARALDLSRAGPAHARDPREALALGITYARAGLDSRAEEAYQRAVELATSAPLPAARSSTLIESLRALALFARRARRYEDAADCWRRILAVRGCPPHVAREAGLALAIHHEHRLRDLGAARTFTLLSLESGGQPAPNEAVRHRLARIDRKIGATGRLPGFPSSPLLPPSCGSPTSARRTSS